MTLFQEFQANLITLYGHGPKDNTGKQIENNIIIVSKNNNSRSSIIIITTMTIIKITITIIIIIIIIIIMIIIIKISTEQVLRGEALGNTAVLGTSL